MNKLHQDSYDLSLDILENERIRIGRELHDDTIQSLVHMVHQTELISHFMEKDPIKAKLELSLLSKNIKDTISNTRNVIYNLRPMAMDDLGFNAAMDEYIFYLNSISDISFVYKSQEELTRLSEDVIINIFRIIQEVCTNSIKHSNAKQVLIQVESDKDFYIIKMDDDGVGCDKKDIYKINHYGLEIVKERVRMISAKYEIDTNKGEGFHIAIYVPMLS